MSPRKKRNVSPCEGSAGFDVGQVVRHTLFGYRGVVFDVDPVFCGTEEWYEKVAESRPPKDCPWYHVLPDGETHTTYVAERNLEQVDDPRPIRHPFVSQVFRRFENGAYVPKRVTH